MEIVLTLRGTTEVRQLLFYSYKELSEFFKENINILKIVAVELDMIHWFRLGLHDGFNNIEPLQFGVDNLFSSYDYNRGYAYAATKNS